MFIVKMCKIMNSMSGISNHNSFSFKIQWVWNKTDYQYAHFIRVSYFLPLLVLQDLYEYLSLLLGKYFQHSNQFWQIFPYSLNHVILRNSFLHRKSQLYSVNRTYCQQAQQRLMHHNNHRPSSTIYPTHQTILSYLNQIL